VSRILGRSAVLLETIDYACVVRIARRRAYGGLVLGAQFRPTRHERQDAAR
jgi:hypothetical protein